MTGPTYYAIGDVHGMTAKLAVLHAAILAEHARVGGTAVVVHLGDYIDRGNDSRGVVEMVMRFEAQAPPGLSVVSLRGNHEQMMLDAIDGEEGGAEALWLGNGGREALATYVRANGASEGDWREAIDAAHIDWLRARPLIHVDGRLVFVHAGIDPETFPECREEIYLWTRNARFFEPERWPDRPELKDLLVVHGHTPTKDFAPFVHPRRINVDTGAVFGGPLSCAVLAPGAPVRMLFG